MSEKDWRFKNDEELIYYVRELLRDDKPPQYYLGEDRATVLEALERLEAANKKIADLEHELDNAYAKEMEDNWNGRD